MSNKEHLEILKQGVKAWNDWRKRNPHIKPDLSNIDSVDVKLGSRDFAGLNLAAADISKCRLIDLSLYEADLSSVEARGAYFGLTNLTWANLTDAKLISCDFFQTNLTSAVLDGADLSDAEMGFTVLGDVDLHLVKGLETVRHFTPSTIGLDTLHLSKGNIPEMFLRGAGVPEPFIAQAKSLVAAMGTIQFYSCFISYSSKDHGFATRLHADLQSKGVRCWFAPENLKIGDRLRPSFDEAINLHDKLMVVLSESSMKSPWVEKEVETAFEKERRQHRTVLFPICLDDSVMETKEAWAADIRRTRHIGDFRDWKNHDSYAKGFDRLLRDLKAEDKSE